jgi:hypothetical protein
MQLPKNPSGITGFNLDSRNDLGYGRLKAKFRKPRSFVQYPEEDENESFEDIDLDTAQKVFSKLLNYQPSDSLAKNKTDSFYYAGSATKISEMSTSKGMVPFPKMYSGRTGSGTGGSGKSLPYPGPTSGFRTNSRPTGTKKGFSKSPYVEPLIDEPKYQLDDIINGDSDENALQDLKKLVRLIHMNQKDQF